MKAVKFIQALFICLLFGFITGCGSSARYSTSVHYGTHWGYHHHHRHHHRPPANIRPPRPPKPKPPRPTHPIARPPRPSGQRR